MTIREAASATGYSLNQLRERLNLLAPYLNGRLRRGPRGALLIDAEVVDILRRLREFENAGLSLREAAAVVLAQDKPEKPKLDPGSPTLAEAEGADRSTTPETGMPHIDRELLRILWILVATLIFSVVAIVALGIVALVL